MPGVTYKGSSPSNSPFTHTFTAPPLAMARAPAPAWAAVTLTAA